MASRIVASPPPKIPFYWRLIAFAIYFPGFLGLDRLCEYASFLRTDHTFSRSAIIAAVFAVSAVTRPAFGGTATVGCAKCKPSLEKREGGEMRLGLFGFALGNAATGASKSAYATATHDQRGLC
ncbi:MAG TPA: hypothetical protein VKD70_06845 [Candidatus Acidoferrum sp.]|nr:hypothetical protein [Candidatus Acidoferrum sp.]